ncbi:MAG: hypothetical protein WBM14_08695 [Terracidiphilus sp.]|jgi:hypothetical protein
MNASAGIEIGTIGAATGQGSPSGAVPGLVRGLATVTALPQSSPAGTQSFRSNLQSSLASLEMEEGVEADTAPTSASMGAAQANPREVLLGGAATGSSPAMPDSPEQGAGSAAKGSNLAALLASGTLKTLPSGKAEAQALEQTATTGLTDKEEGKADAADASHGSRAVHPHKDAQKETAGIQQAATTLQAGAVSMTGSAPVPVILPPKPPAAGNRSPSQANSDDRAGSEAGFVAGLAARPSIRNLPVADGRGGAAAPSATAAGQAGAGTVAAQQPASSLSAPVFNKAIEAPAVGASGKQAVLDSGTPSAAIHGPGQPTGHIANQGTNSASPLAVPQSASSFSAPVLDKAIEASAMGASGKQAAAGSGSLAAAFESPKPVSGPAPDRAVDHASPLAAENQADRPAAASPVPDLNPSQIAVSAAPVVGEGKPAPGSARTSGKTASQPERASGPHAALAQGVQPFAGQTSAPASAQSSPFVPHDPSGVNAAMAAGGSGVSSSSSSGSGAATSGVRDTFAALDAESGTAAPTWTHADAHYAEAGYQDPALGWVGVRAQVDANGIHAAVVPGSADAAQSLSGHLAGLNAYLAEHHAPVETLTIAAPETGWNGQGMGQGGGQSGRQGSGQGGYSGQQTDLYPGAAAVAPAGRSIAAANDGRLDATQTGVPPGGVYISVMA